MATTAIKEFRQEIEQKLENFHKQKNATVNQVYEEICRATGLNFNFSNYGTSIAKHGMGYRNFFYNAKMADGGLLLRIGNVRGHAVDYSLVLIDELVLSHYFLLPNQASLPLEDEKNELRDKVYRSLTIKPCTVSELVTEFTAITGLRFLFKRIDTYGKRSDGRLLEGIFFVSESDGKNEPIQLSIMHAERWVLTWSITCSTGTIDTADMPHPVDFLHKGVQC